MPDIQHMKEMSKRLKHVPLTREGIIPPTCCWSVVLQVSFIWTTYASHAWSCTYTFIQNSILINMFTVLAIQTLNSNILSTWSWFNLRITWTPFMKSTFLEKKFNAITIYNWCSYFICLCFTVLCTYSICMHTHQLKRHTFIC
jgi:hypothetical protein